MLETITNYEYNTKEQSLIDELSKEDKIFLSLFYDGHKKLTQKEIAQKLGITQQGVHKRLKMIRNKYKDKRKWEENSRFFHYSFLYFNYDKKIEL